MRRLNRSRAEIEHYFNSPQYRNEQDYIRGRVNYVGGRELWRERAARLQEEADLQQVYNEQNMSRFNDYYGARGRGRGRSRGRGSYGRGRGRSQGYRAFPQEYYGNNGNMNRERMGRDEEDNSGNRAPNPPRRDSISERGIDQTRNREANETEPRTARVESSDRPGEVRNHDGVRNQNGNTTETSATTNETGGDRRRSEFRGIDTRRRRNERSGSQREALTIPQGIPVAEMRSNDASQDDSMPVGNVVGIANSPNQNRNEGSARAETALSRSSMRDARRDSASRYRISRAMYPDSGTPQEEQARTQLQQQVVANGRSIH